MLVQSIPYPMSTYVETTFVGNQVGTNAVALGASGTDFKNVFAATVPSGGVWFKKIVFKAQLINSGTHFRPVIYNGITATANIIATGQDIALTPLATSSPGVLYTLDFRADGAATFLAAGTIGIGAHLHGVCDVKADASFSGANWNVDTYSDGPSDPFGTIGGTEFVPVMYLPVSVSGP